jgi:hypothetical protein
MVRVSSAGNPQQDPKPVAYSFRELRLHEDVNNDAFERFMIGELFPTIDTSDNGFGPDQHLLLQDDWHSDVYVWVSRLEYFVHQTPFPAWFSSRLGSMYEDAREKLEPFGAYTSEGLEISYDVASMGGRFS